MGIYDFLFATEFQKLEYGNAFWLPSYNSRGRLKEIYLLDSLKMEIVVDEYGRLYGKPDVYYLSLIHILRAYIWAEGYPTYFP